MAVSVAKFVHEEETDADAPVRYLPLTRLYSATSPCLNSALAQPMEPLNPERLPQHGEKVPARPPVIRVYERRRKRVDGGVGAGLDSGVAVEEEGVVGLRGEKEPFRKGKGKASQVERGDKRRKLESSSKKMWIELCFENVDPNAFVGLHCKVFWPLDDKWYSGSITGHSHENQKHMIKYDDSDNESLILSSEKIKFHVSREQVELLNIRMNNSKVDREGAYIDELIALAASYDDCQIFETGDIVWAKLSGHSIWPAVVISEAHASACKGLKQVTGEKFVPVQFFGTHDYARINLKQAIPFLKGLLSSFHSKCKQSRFDRALDEARTYLSERKLPKKMARAKNGFEVGEGGTDCDDNETEYAFGGVCSEGIDENLCPLQLRDFKVLKLDSSKVVFYKMEVLRNPQAKARPLFRVTMKNGKQIDGSTPSACWKKIYKKSKMRNNLANGIHGRKMIPDGTYRTGSYMFGFSLKKVNKLIKGLPGAKFYLKSSCSNLVAHRTVSQLSDYRPVHVEWKDLDKCNVCHMDEEYLDNLFLQCDKCRMMVHARCYGEEPMDGVLWLCNLCRDGAPSSPPCCFCPVTGSLLATRKFC